MDRGAGRDGLALLAPRTAVWPRPEPRASQWGGHKRCGEQVNPANTKATCGTPHPPHLLSSAADGQRQSDAGRRGGSAVAPLGFRAAPPARAAGTQAGGPAGACSLHLGLCTQALGGRANTETWATANCHLPHTGKGLHEQGDSEHPAWIPAQQGLEGCSRFLSRRDNTCEDGR